MGDPNTFLRNIAALITSGTGVSLMVLALGLAAVNAMFRDGQRGLFAGVLGACCVLYGCAWIIGRATGSGF